VLSPVERVRHSYCTGNIALACYYFTLINLALAEKTYFYLKCLTERLDFDLGYHFEKFSQFLTTILLSIQASM